MPIPAARLQRLVPIGAIFFLTAQTAQPRSGDVFAANLGDHSVTFFDGATGAFKGVFVRPDFLPIWPSLVPPDCT